MRVEARGRVEEDGIDREGRRRKGMRGKGNGIKMGQNREKMGRKEKDYRWVLTKIVN